MPVRDPRSRGEVQWHGAARGHWWLVSGSGSSPLNTWAVIIDVIDPIDRRLEVGVLYPLRPR